MRDIHLGNLTPHPLGKDRSFRGALITDYDSEFLASDPRGELSTAFGILTQNLGNFFQTNVTCRVAKCIVVFFEMIDIYHQQR